MSDTVKKMKIPVYRYDGTVTLTVPITGEGGNSAEAEEVALRNLAVSGAGEAVFGDVKLERTVQVGEREVE